MKGLSVFNKVILAINIPVALLFFLACLSPYLSIKTVPFLPFLALSLPVLVLLNLLFFCYWSIKRSKWFLFSLLPLLIGYFFLGDFIKFGFKDNVASKEDLTVLSYNVRQFNRHENLESETIFEDIKALIEEQDADVICLQESSHEYHLRNYDYPHRYSARIPLRDKTILTVFSKYPILDAELINFPDSKNLACYTDILVENDTIRVYNLHMQSLGITPGSGTIRKSSKPKLYKRMVAKFEKQEEQAKLVASHMQSAPYKKIITGDFNNNQFSRTYHLIKGNNNDTFDEKGSGFGRTFIFHRVPARIDFILADPAFEVTSHKNFDVKYSDHYPILASFRLKED